MALDTLHPAYQLMFDTWQKMADAYAGEDAIKAAGTIYLPPTSAMTSAGMEIATAPGAMAYDAYKLRASYPDLVGMGVETLLGSMWAKPAVFELPPQLEYMLQSASIDGEGLNQVLMKINEAQLSTGGIGLLLDIAVEAASNTGVPYIAMYSRPTIVNWNEGQRDETDVRRTLSLVVLSETEQTMDPISYQWRLQPNWRVLRLLNAEQTKPVYQVYVAVNSNDPPTDADFKEPNIRGVRLETIPFVFINTKDLLPTPDKPPLLPLANISLTIYRGEADYRQNLFMQAQDTLVLIGSTDDGPVRIGATAVIKLSAAPGVDAKFIGVSAEGLGGQRQALTDDRNNAAAMSGQLLDTVSRQKESGAALDIRVSAKTASLRQIVKTGAAGLERILKIAALWLGASPDAVKVTPNYDFADMPLLPDDLVKLMSAKALGAPISIETVHEIMVDRGMTELTFEDELAKIESETSLIPETPATNDATLNDNPTNTTTGGA